MTRVPWPVWVLVVMLVVFTFHDGPARTTDVVFAALMVVAYVTKLHDR